MLKYIYVKQIAKFMPFPKIDVALAKSLFFRDEWLFALHSVLIRWISL
jgi:hypothetical protein